MKRRRFLCLLGATGLQPFAAGTKPVYAQTPQKVHRIGWLTAQRAASLAPYIQVVRSALADIGYVEGRNLAIEFRYGDDAVDRVPALAAELVGAPVELILVQGAAVPIVSSLGLPVPMVFVTSTDPITSGLAESLAKPRGNVTGLSFMAAEFNAKRLELMKEIIPGLRRVAIIGNPEHPGEQLERAYTGEAAQRLGMTSTFFATRSRAELEGAFTAMAENPPQAISVFGDGFALQNRQAIIEFATRQRIPVISGWAVFAESGALCTFGPRLSESYRRLAYFVDRILKGAKPSDLPIEQPTHFELVVNLKTAKALGITLAESFIARADTVIE